MREERRFTVRHVQLHSDLENPQGGQQPDGLRAAAAVECRGMSRQVRARGDAQRKPEVEGVVARVVVRNAGMLVERLRGRSLFLWGHFAGHQAGLVAQRAGIEDRGKLPHDPAVLEPADGGEDFIFAEAAFFPERPERPFVKRQAGLQRVE